VARWRSSSKSQTSICTLEKWENFLTIFIYF
jgi:hypothetical protein